MTNHTLFEENNKYIKVKIDFIDGKYRAGVSVHFGNYGCGGLPSKHDEGFNTENECLENAKKYIQKYLIENGEDENKVKKILFLSQEIQLTLF